MKKSLAYAALCAGLIFAAGPALADSIKVPVNQVSADGVGKQIGSVTFTDADGGMDIQVDVSGLSAGQHGMHIHQNPSCEPAEQDGKMTAALAAGGHWDPDGTKTHKGPGNAGHKGDLPFITASDKGVAQEKLFVKGLTTKEIKGHSLMIHAGGDNYSDTPVLGGGGPRIACGVIK